MPFSFTVNVLSAFVPVIVSVAAGFVTFMFSMSENVITVLPAVIVFAVEETVLFCAFKLIASPASSSLPSMVIAAAKSVAETA